MAKKDKKQTGRRTTIYRLVGLEDLRDAIRPKYLGRTEFTATDLVIADQPALLLTGAMEKDRADWCAEVSALTGEDLVIAGSTPAGVLLLRPSVDGASAGVAYALTYGMGFQLLDPGFLDNLFGQRIAVRTAEPDKLRSVTVTTMDERSRTSRATIPQGDGLMGFGLGDIGEAVSRIVAIANLPDLSRSDGKALQLRGADALNVPLGRTVDEVLADLTMLEGLLAVDPPEELKILEQLTAVKNPKTREMLDNRLSAVLDGAPGTIGLGWPHERIDENGTPDSWIPGNLWPRRQNLPRQGQPEWDDIVAALDLEQPGMRLDRVDRATIQLCRDAEGKEPISQAIPLRRWIAFQTDLDERTYALYDGGWFQIHHDYAGNINSRTAEIFARSVEDIAFPAWEPADDEEAYNKNLAVAVGGVCLDRKLIKTPLHRRGIEACDVYLPDGSLIHVKRTEKSSAASHLIAQALVSADALCNDAEARATLRQRIVAAGGDASQLAAKPKRVILAAHRRDAQGLSAEDLFTFTKVNLVRQATALEERSVPVRIVSVPAAD
jgi:uncharacterized protein (TIGR04141 family)